MRTRMMGRVAALALAFILCPAMAWSSVRISVVGAGIVDKPKDNSGDTYASKPGIGGGALLDYMFHARTDLELGALYITRKADDSTTSQTTKTTVFQFPLLLRYWFNPMISLGAGGYYSYGTGSISEISDSSNATTTHQYSEGLKKSDYGVLGSLALRFPMGSGVGFLVDARYAYGLNNVNNGIFTGTSYKYRDIQALIGFQFGMFGGSR